MLYTKYIGYYLIVEAVGSLIITNSILMKIFAILRIYIGIVLIGLECYSVM